MAYPGAVFATVDLAVSEVILIGEVRLERQMLATLVALKTLLVEDDLIDWSHLLHLVDTVSTSRTRLRRRRFEELAQTLGCSV